MPVRMWLLLVASIVALILAFQTESVLSIARIAFVYMVVVAVLIGSAVAPLPGANTSVVPPLYLRYTSVVRPM
jgi:amino acid permease